MMKLLILFAGLILTSCEKNSDVYEIPIEIFLEETNGRDSLKFKVRVEESDVFSLGVFFSDASEGKGLEYSEYIEILGLKTFDGLFENLGVPATYSVRIVQVGSEYLVMQREIVNPISDARTGGRIARLVEVGLSRGVYEIEVQFLSGDLKVKQLATSLYFGEAYLGK